MRSARTAEVRRAMDRPQRWRVLALVASVGVLAAAVAFGGVSVRDWSLVPSYARALGHRLRAPLSPLGLESSVTPPEAGSMLRGGEIVSYSEGGRGAKPVRGTAGGRMIYTGTEAWEPTLGIDKKGNIFFQGADRAPVVVVSRDVGRSWDEVTPPTHAITFDPMLYVDKSTGRTFTADLTEIACVSVSHTDDVGHSWTTSKACGLADHQNVFAGPPVSSPTVGYPNVVYMCAIDGGVGTPFSTVTSCLKSLDGGITWVRTGTPAYTADPRQGEGQYGIAGWCDGSTGHGFVDSKGVVYLPRGWCKQPYLAISKDEGATWERIQVARNGVPQAGPLFSGDTAVSVDGTGNIYYFWVARDRLPYLAVSTDKGESFSKPMMVGPPGLKEAWGPTMDIDDTGKVALAYVGSTNAPGGDSPDGVGPEYTDAVTWNGYITTSVNALSNKPRFFTASVNRPSDPIVRGECHVIACGVQYDFIDVVIGPDGAPWTSMVDGWCRPPADPCSDVGQGFVGTVVGGPTVR